MERLPSFLEGPRLTLRRWEEDDAPALGEAIEESLSRLLPFMPWAALEPLAIEARHELFVEWDKKWRAGGEVYLGMFCDEEIVGATGLHARGRSDRVEIGYWVRNGHTGKGYAIEAARLLTTAALQVPGIEIVAIHHDLANDASRRIPEGLGFTLARQIETDLEAHGQTGVELQWEMTRERWSLVAG